MEINESELLDHHFKDGYHFFIEGDVQKSIEELKIVLQSKDIDKRLKKSALIGLSTSYANLAEWDKAIFYCKEALQLTPDDASCYLVLGCAYIDNNQYDLAHEALINSLDLEPICFDARYHLGNLYKYQHRIEDAIIEYKTAISLDPKNFYVYGSLASVYLIQKNWRLAKRMLLIARAFGIAEVIEEVTGDKFEDLLKAIDEEINKL